MAYVILWIVAITVFTFLGAWYARKFNRPDALIALYVTFLILSQITAVKIAEYDLGFMAVTAPAAVLIYSVTYLFTDIVNEKFGRSETHRMIYIAFVAQIAMVFFLWLGTVLKPASFWPNQPAWESIISLVPRITLASMVSFFISENLDAIIFHGFKKLTNGKYLWMRNVFSSIPALTLDTILFITIAFYGTMSIWPLIIGQITTKYLVCIINIPFMYLNRWIMFGLPERGKTVTNNYTTE